MSSSLISELCYSLTNRIQQKWDTAVSRPRTLKKKINRKTIKPKKLHHQLPVTWNTCSWNPEIILWESSSNLQRGSYGKELRSLALNPCEASHKQPKAIVRHVSESFTHGISQLPGKPPHRTLWGAHMSLLHWVLDLWEQNKLPVLLFGNNKYYWGN